LRFSFLIFPLPPPGGWDEVGEEGAKSVRSLFFSMQRRNGHGSERPGGEGKKKERSVPLTGVERGGKEKRGVCRRFSSLFPLRAEKEKRGKRKGVGSGLSSSILPGGKKKGKARLCLLSSPPLEKRGEKGENTLNNNNFFVFPSLSLLS